VRARGAVVATLIVVLLMSALYPIRQYFGQKSNVHSLVAQESALSRRIAVLRHEQNLLLSDDETERIAREELGMVRRGEVAFAVLPDDAGKRRAAAAAPAAPQSRASSRGTWYHRWWGAVVDAVTGVR
jgi:cell division protein FtsB